MRTFVLWCLVIGYGSIFAQPAVDSTAAEQQAVESTAKEIQGNLQDQIRQLADSIRNTSGTEEAVAEIEALREELNNSIAALNDSLRREESPGAVGGMVDQFQGSFERIWEGLSTTLTPGKLGAMALILIIGVSINAIIRRWVGPKDTTPHKQRLRRLRWYPLLRFMNWSLVIILLAALLLQHPDVLWPALTALAIGLGLAIKDGLVDLLGGIWLIIDQPYQIGDRIRVGEHYGEVTRIGIRSTQITTLDDNLVTIPNSNILNDPVANSNAGQTHCMAVVRIWLPLIADLKMARTTAYEAAVTSRYFNFDKGVDILFQDNISDPPGTIIQVKAYVLDAKFEKAFEGDVTETVKRALMEGGVY